MAEQIWYDNPYTLFTQDTVLKILPASTMTYAEQLNSVFRLSVYYGFLVSLIKGSPEMLLVPAGIAAVTFLLYRSFKLQGQKEGFGTIPSTARASSGSEVCVKPTKSNPFMNVLNGDRPDRRQACDPLDPAVKASMQDNFNRSMFFDVDDVWGRNNAGRNFNTTPSTTVPNDQEMFAEWLYSGIRAGGKHTRPPRNSAF